MGLSEEQELRMRRETRDAAGAFLEDMSYMRQLLDQARKKVSGGEIRRLSSLLRRLIVDRDIAKISAPRLGKLTIVTPDNRFFYRKSEEQPYLIFISGCVDVFGTDLLRLMAFNIQVNPTITQSRIVRKAKNHAEKVTYANLNLDQFAQQRVISYKGRWITRQTAIKYLANISSGVHSDLPREADDVALAQMRSGNSISIKDGKCNLALFSEGIESTETKINFSPDSLDLVLVEVLAATSHLTKSPMILQLEEFVKNEIHS